MFVKATRLSEQPLSCLCLNVMRAPSNSSSPPSLLTPLVPFVLAPFISLSPNMPIHLHSPSPLVLPLTPSIFLPLHLLLPSSFSSSYFTFSFLSFYWSNPFPPLLSSSTSSSPPSSHPYIVPLIPCPLFVFISFSFIFSLSLPLTPLSDAASLCH